MFQKITVEISNNVLHIFEGIIEPTKNKRNWKYFVLLY